MDTDPLIQNYLDIFCKPGVNVPDKDPFCFRIKVCSSGEEKDNYRIEPLSTNLSNLDPIPQKERIQHIKDNKPVVVLVTGECVQIIDVHKCYSDPEVVHIKEELTSCTQCPYRKFSDCQRRYELYAERIEGESADVVLINGKYWVKDLVQEVWREVDLKNRCFYDAGQGQGAEKVNPLVAVRPVPSCESCLFWKLRDCSTDQIIYASTKDADEFQIGTVIEGRVVGGDVKCYEVVDFSWWENVEVEQFQRTSEAVYASCSACESFIYFEAELCLNTYCFDFQPVTKKKFKTKNKSILSINTFKIPEGCYSKIVQQFPENDQIDLYTELDDFQAFASCQECISSGFTGNIYLIQDISKANNILTITVAWFKVVNGLIYGPCGSPITYTCKCCPPQY